VNPANIPLHQKVAHIQAFSEKEFRDRIIRPIFLRRKYRHGAELCGVSEAGKDCTFTTEDAFGEVVIHVVQTKVGNLNLGREPSKSVVQAIIQLRTAMQVPLIMLASKRKVYPTFAFLCTSGRINEQAQQYICSETGLTTANLRFLDVDNVVPIIDEEYPEFWAGIDSDRIPYLRDLSRILLEDSDAFGLSGLLTSNSGSSPISDAGWAPLRLNRPEVRLKKVNGKVERETRFEEIAADKLFEKLKQPQVAIFGEAGSGKSTILKRIAESLCKQLISGNSNQPIPVLLRAVWVSKSNNSLAIDATKQTEELTLSTSSAFTDLELQGGKVTLLIDGIDEIGVIQHRDNFDRKLDAFVSAYPLCPIVVTSRNYSFVRKMKSIESFSDYSVSPIGFKEVSKIIKNVGKGKALTPAKSKELLRQLETVHGFDLNPLLVTVFVATSDGNRRDIPANITELFSKFTETLLGRWDTSKGLSQQHESGIKDLLLQSIAYYMHGAKQTSIDSAEFRKRIKDEMESQGISGEKSDELCDEILRSGLLRDVGSKLEFRHLLLQEFFAGRAIPDRFRLKELVPHEWWRRSVVFHFGDNPKNDSGLLELCANTAQQNSEEKFNLAVTIGLAAQACYFIKTISKVEIFKWVIENLAENTIQCIGKLKDEKYPMHTFLFMYLMARDSVAADCMKLIEEFSPLWKDSSDPEVAEARQFWHLVGLMESGNLGEDYASVADFSPKHLEMILALQVGAFMIEHVRTSDSSSRQLASQLSRELAPKIAPLRAKFLAEFKSHILEIRAGRIVEIESSSEVIEIEE